MLIASQAMSCERDRASSHLSPHPSRFSRVMLAILVGCGISLCNLPAFAARVADEVGQLLDQGKADQAAKQADGYLKQNPNDVEMRFLRGVIATEQKQNAQAIKIFSALTREYPSMPEPYNNLAVLYAAEGQERKAAEALEQAIRTNPSYTTAHENLGDLYARMASEAYAKALQLDESRQGLRPKLALITQLTPLQQAAGKTLVAEAGAPSAPAAAPPAPALKNKAPEPKPEPKPESKPAPKPELKAETKPEPKVEVLPAPKVEAKPAPKVEAKPESKTEAKPEPKAEPKTVAKAEVNASKPAPAPASAPAAPAAKPPPEAPSKSAAQQAASEVESAVNTWAAAWEKQDMQRYLDAYSDKFTPADGSSLPQWKEARRVRIVGKNSISVSLRNLQVKVNGEQATAQFRQNYAAGSLKTTTRKTLALQREKGHWKILRETTGG